MRFLFAMLFAAAATMGTAQAADVTIKLNDKEQQAMLQLLDLAAKQGGVRAAGAVAFFVQKLQPSQSPTDVPVVSEEKKPEHPTAPADKK